MGSSRPAVNRAWPRGGRSNSHPPVCFNLHAELLDFQGCCLPLFFPCTGSGAGPAGFRASSRSHPLEAVLLTGPPPRGQPRTARPSGRPGPPSPGAAPPLAGCARPRPGQPSELPAAKRFPRASAGVPAGGPPPGEHRGRRRPGPRPSVRGPQRQPLSPQPPAAWEGPWERPEAGGRGVKGRPASGRWDTF